MRGAQLGTYPTPVQRLAALEETRTELWCKRDDLTNADYGGNKVRKLEQLIDHARRCEARRLLTFGAAGSHHVLATAIHGARAGFRVAAVLTPRVGGTHELENIRAALSSGLQPYVASSFLGAAITTARVHAPGDYLIAPGGSSVRGAQGYGQAARELGEQIRSGKLAEPDIIVVALGTGGTAAGLVAGVAQLGMRTIVHAVRVVPAPLVTRSSVLWLARGVSRWFGATTPVTTLSRHLRIDDSMLGRGYGYKTGQAEQAIVAASAHGLQLESTYTGKAFAAAQACLKSLRFSSVLYWHTLSSAPMGPLLAHAPTESELDPALAALIRPE